MAWLRSELVSSLRKAEGEGIEVVTASQPGGGQVLRSKRNHGWSLEYYSVLKYSELSNKVGRRWGAVRLK